MFIGRKLPGPPYCKQDSYQPWELDMVLYDAEGRYDLYLTQNRFEGRRKVLQQHVWELSALYVDVDYYDVPELAGRPPEAVYEMALALLREAGIPEPSLAFCSGQGIYLVWLHTPVGWKELPRWQDCQYRLYKLLKPLGADAHARDAARVLRVVGTTNSKNGDLVYALCDAEPRRGFEELAERMLRAEEDDKQQAGRICTTCGCSVLRGASTRPRSVTPSGRCGLLGGRIFRSCAGFGTVTARWTTSGTGGCSSPASR